MCCPASWPPSPPLHCSALGQRGREVEGVGHKTKDEEGRGGGGAGEEGGITLALGMGAVDTTTSQQ